MAFAHSMNVAGSIMVAAGAGCITSAGGSTVIPISPNQEQALVSSIRNGREQRSDTLGSTVGSSGDTAEHPTLRVFGVTTPPPNGLTITMTKKVSG
jgi:hypothetical protein